MAPLSQPDKSKINSLYKSIKDIQIPEFEDEETIALGQKIQEGLEIILQAIKEASTIINQ